MSEKLKTLAYRRQEPGLPRFFAQVALLSLALCIPFIYWAAKLQLVENSFGPPGIHDLNAPPGFYHFSWAWNFVAMTAALPVTWLAAALLQRSWGTRAKRSRNNPSNVTGVKIHPLS